MGTPANPLESAKKALEKANKFTRSVEGNLPSRFAPKTHPYSSASYANVRAERKRPPVEVATDRVSPQTEKEAKDIASGVNWRLKQQKEVTEDQKQNQ